MILKVKTDLQFINFLLYYFKALFILTKSTQQTMIAVEKKMSVLSAIWSEAEGWQSGCAIHGRRTPQSFVAFIPATYVYLIALEAKGNFCVT